MFRLIKDHPKQPIPDWSFTVDETVLRAPSADKLLAKIVAYRTHNGQPPGNPEHEVAVSLIVRYPHLVKEIDTGPALIDPLWTWVNRLWREPPRKPAHEDEVKRRVSVCTKCDRACPIKPDKELERRAYLLAQGDLRLTTQCAHHRWHNGLAVNLAEPAQWGRKGSPPQCWHAAD